MRHSLVKLTALLAALMLTLTGCNLIGIDMMKKLDMDFAELQKDHATVVAKYDGGELTKGDAIGTFASMYAYYSQLYSMFGMSLTSDVIENVKQESLESAIQDVAIAKEFDARGMTLSDEKLAEVQSTADSNYQQAYDSFYAQAEGKGDVKVRQTEYNLQANGYSREAVYARQLASAKREALEEALKAEVADLTEEQMQAAYDAKVEEDKESYTDDASAFETAMADADDIVTWMPEGYRTVKHILVKPDSELLTAVTDARTALDTAESTLKTFEEELAALSEIEGEADAEARTADAIQADIDAARAEVEAARPAVATAEAAVLDSVKAKTDEIYAKLAEGAEFSALIAEYGEDPGMQNEPTATRGYYVCANSANWDANFTAGAMALQKVGDVSATPVISTSGVHIIRYESDVTPGPVPLDSVREDLHDSALETAKDDHVEETLKSLTEALHPEYMVSAFNIG